jgi:rhodanese-related sulfurtransferase
MRSLSAGELQQRLQSEAAPFLLDVREAEEMAYGRIAGSVHIPMGEVEHRLDELPTDRDIIVICHVGERSGYVTWRLNALGYDRAVNLRGGMDAWLAGQSRQQPNGRSGQ